MTSDLSPRMLRELIAGEPDAREAVAARTRDCPSDEALSVFAADEPAPERVERLLAHLRACPRCLNLALLLADDARAPQWAVEATREATARWRQTLADATVHIFPFRQMNAQFVAVAAAPPDRREARITLDSDHERYTVEVKRGEEPEVGVEVVLTPADGGEPRRCRTNASGVAEFADLPAGRYRLRIEGCEEPIRVEDG